VTDLWGPLVQDPYVDYVVLMNYFNTEDEFLGGEYGTGIGGVNPILASLQGRVPAVFAAETIMPPYCPPRLTFWTNGTLPLENMLGDVGRTYATSRGFLGLATHHYGSYFLLPPAGPITPACRASASSSGTGGTVVVSPNTAAYVCAVVYQISAGGAWKAVAEAALAGDSDVSVRVSAPGPYAIELYDGAGCVKASVVSAVPATTCT
jgi:hypothetical protein